jgi:hypothetical protein
MPKTSNRATLFDLAVNRALSYLERLGALEGPVDRKGWGDLLRTWQLNTRFAYRIPLEMLLETLASYPGEGHYWQGGPPGRWCRGVNPRP